MFIEIYLLLVHSLGLGKTGSFKVSFEDGLVCLKDHVLVYGETVVQVDPRAVSARLISVTIVEYPRVAFSVVSYA